MADDIFDDFDKESQKFLQGVKFLNFDEVNSGKVGNQNPLAIVRTNKSFEEISNEYAIKSPSGKDSVFYKPQIGTLRAFLNDKNRYEEVKNQFKNIDLESIFINGTISLKQPGQEHKNQQSSFCDQKKLQIVQHVTQSNFEEYLSAFFDKQSKKLTTYLDNFTWFTEGDNSNLITFHFFVKNNSVEEVICTMGSDIFDCLKTTTDINATGGFTIKNEKDELIVNPQLKEFKSGIVKWAVDLYYNSDKIPKRYNLNETKLFLALDKEFEAEGDYQRAVDWIFEKIEITTSFKNLINDFILSHRRKSVFTVLA
jgi:hypothetical protein